MTPTATKNQIFEAVGRRKTAVARVRLFPGKESRYEINGKALEAYFPVAEHASLATEVHE